MQRDRRFAKSLMQRHIVQKNMCEIFRVFIVMEQCCQFKNLQTQDGATQKKGIYRI